MSKVKDLIADVDAYEADIPSVKIAKAELLDTLVILNELLPEQQFSITVVHSGPKRAYELWNKDWKIARTRTAYEMFRFVEGMLAYHTMLSEKEGE